MSVAMHDGRAEPTRADEMLDRLRLRLADTVGDLRPERGGLFDLEALQERLYAVAEELHDIERQLRLVAHIAEIDSGVLEDQIRDIEKKLTEGWVPPARSAAEIVDELRRLS